MAQNQFVNVTIDPSTSKKVDGADHRHTVSQSSAVASDFSVGLDSAKITTMTIFDSCVAAARKIYAGQLKP